MMISSKKKKKSLMKCMSKQLFWIWSGRETDLTLTKFPFLLMKRENKAANINYLRIMVEVPMVEETFPYNQ